MSKNKEANPKPAPVIEDVEVVTVSSKGEETKPPEEKTPKTPKEPKRKREKKVVTSADIEKQALKINVKRIPYERKRRLYGYGFAALWAVGAIWLFAVPLIKSLIGSLTENGAWNGFANYIAVFSENTELSGALVTTLYRIIPRSFVIMLFSLFIAVILNQKFRGRGTARAFLFLPVLIAASPAFSVIKADMAFSGVLSAERFGALFENDLAGGFLKLMDIAPRSAAYIQALSESILSAVWNSGVQILLFLAALKNIPPSLREAADIEGVTPWVFFWKITVPSVSPMILAGFIYTFVDDFISPDNELMRLVLSMQKSGNIGSAAAAALIYFAAAAVIIGIIALVTSRFAFRENE